MTFMRKILDALDTNNWNGKNKSVDFQKDTKKYWERNKKEILESFQWKIESANSLIIMAKNASTKEEFYNCINEIKALFSEFQEKEDRKSPYDKYNKNIQKQRESNLHISYADIESYDQKPFDLKQEFISDNTFTAIELSGNNLEIAYEFLKEINSLLSPRKYLYEDAEFPTEISTEYEYGKKLPVSHLRLLPYTAAMRKSKYPLCLWLSKSGDYGTEYLYTFYFDKNGILGQCELSLHGADGIGISYETKLRRNGNGLYVLRISKTLYSPPYGTTTIYHHRDDNENSEKYSASKMQKVDLEQYARECNAYVVREERKKSD